MKELIENIEWLAELIDIAKNGLSLDAFSEVLKGPIRFLLYGDASVEYAHEAAELSPLLTQIYDVIFPIGAIFIMIAFFTKIMELIMFEQLSYEALIKNLATVIIVLMLVGNGPVLFSYIYEIFDTVGTDFFTMATENITPSTDDFIGFVKELWDQEGNDLITIIVSILTGTAILVVVYTLFMIVFTIVMNAILKAVLAYHSLYRAVRLGIYIVMMPLAVSDIYASNGGNKLVDYCKKLGAIVIQEYVILFDIAILLTLFESSSLIDSLLIFFLSLSAIKSSFGRAEQIMGAK